MFKIGDVVVFGRFSKTQYIIIRCTETRILEVEYLSASTNRRTRIRGDWNSSDFKPYEQTPPIDHKQAVCIKIKQKQKRREEKGFAF